MPSRQARRSADVVPRLAARLAEKIELNLLLADLAFKRRNSALRPGLLLQ
jgi:hypothetical protein